MKNEKLNKLVATGLFAALSYVVFTFLQIRIPLPGGDATSFHLGNAVCVVGALVLGGVYGGIGGAIGGYIGAKLLKKLPERILKIAFTIFLIYVSLKMILK